MKKALLLIIVQLLFLQAYAQVTNEQLGGTKVWYSNYLHKRLNQRFAIDNFSMLGLRSVEHRFGFFQTDLGVRFRFNRIWSVRAGYGLILFKHNNWWKKRYKVDPKALNSVVFQNLSFEVSRTDRPGRYLKIKQKLVGQAYIPKFEKYQLRFQYVLKLSYRRSNLPLKMKPFIQGAVYYYQNGAPIVYKNENKVMVNYGTPNGIHRFRIKGGINFKPFKGKRLPSFSLYYAYNREFNIDGFGRDLNVTRISPKGKKRIVNRFNNFGIIGLQMNWFL